MRNIIFLIFLFSKLAFSYINIYPTSFNKNITNGATETFKLYNRTETEKKYRIYIEPSSEQDMSNWIEVYPKSIFLNPLEEKEVRLFVNPPLSASKGEYKAKLIIKEISSTNNKEKINLMTLFKLNMKGHIKK